ncbi:hypothetical protein NUH88_05060 [Nisaea acidiphila]|uniref:Uncharacterized protein n=1 Tax=Nisaea acidiphila TaxID=1862145 RepID=A0A9J7AYZ4_9PROT|nr:hypothetical protein [Nisaea acidiphila]UUX52302.1 hypothetical protein NUH88_05060 [Nisaea acidiphila]
MFVIYEKKLRAIARQDFRKAVVQDPAESVYVRGGRNPAQEAGQAPETRLGSVRAAA